MTKQDKIDELEQENDALRNQLRRLQDTSESQFIGSKTYCAMKNDLKHKNILLESKLSDFDFWKQQTEKARLEAAQAQKDNQRLLQQIDPEGRYKIGMPEDRTIEQLEAEIRGLKARVKARDQTFAFIRKAFMDYMYDGAEEKPEVVDPSDDVPIPKMGKPKQITEPEKREMRQYRRRGYSIREIADISGMSIGTVQSVVQRVRVRPETLKEHKAERKKKK